MTKSKAPIVSLPKGKGTQNTKPPASNPDPIPRGERRPDKDEKATDTIRRQADKARWPGYGEGSADTATLLREQRAIEGKADLSSGSQDEEEDASDLTVPQLKEALDVAEVEYPANAKKADLVKLYEANGLGDQ